MLKVLVRDPENLKSVLSEDREWFMKEYEVILTWIQENGFIGDNQSDGDKSSNEFEQDHKDVQRYDSGSKKSIKS